MKKVCVVVSTLMTARAFLRDQLCALAAQYDVTVIANEADPDALVRERIPVRVRYVDIRRPIAPVFDLLALWRLYRIMRSERYDLVHSFTPKAGLLAMSAALLARVPHRIHTFTGQVWVTRRGFVRYLLKSLDRLISHSASCVLVDSHSQHQFLLDEGVVTLDRSGVLGAGSISGVDTSRFSPDSEVRARVRRELGVPDQAPLILFLGRLNRDKGVLDLLSAFRGLASAQPDVRLLIVGPDEERLGNDLARVAAQCPGRVHRIDNTPIPENYMRAADIFCLPSYREGFGSVVIEAAACGVPAIASRIYGLTDAVVDGVTGFLHEPGRVDDLRTLLERLCADGDLRRNLGDAARKRASKMFAMETITAELLEKYSRWLSGPEGVTAP